MVSALRVVAVSALMASSGAGVARGQATSPAQPTSPAQTDGAAEAPPPAPQAPSLPRTNAKLTFDATHSLDSDFDGGPGSVSVSRFSADLGVRIQTDEKSAFNVSLSSEISSYKFKGATGLDPVDGDPWDDALRIELSGVYSRQLDDRWGYFVGLGVLSTAEFGAEFDDSLAGGGFGGVSYTFSEDFSAGLGLMVRSRIEDDVLIVPIVQIDWTISEKWSAGTRTGANFIGGGVRYAATDDWTIDLLAGYVGRDFRLDDEGPAPDGVGRETSVPVYLQATWAATRQISLTGKLGVLLANEYTLDDSDGRELAEFETEMPIVAALQVEFRF